MKTLLLKAGDFSIDADNGQLEWVEDGDKLVQELAECLLLKSFVPRKLEIAQGQIPYARSLKFLEYGSELSSLEETGLPKAHMQNWLSMQVEEAVNKLMNVQKSQGDLPPTEEVVSYDVQTYPLGNLSFVFYLNVTTRDGSYRSTPEFRVDLSHITTTNDILRLG